jgi:hypothetical protein
VVHIGIQEVRAERKRRREMDERLVEKITQVGPAQLLTEEALRNFINPMCRGGQH